jgi:hypothetical protein
MRRADTHHKRTQPTPNLRRPPVGPWHWTDRWFAATCGAGDWCGRTEMFCGG